MARGNSMRAMNFELNRFANEDELKAVTMAVTVRSPKVNHSVRDKSCIMTFPCGTHESKLTRLSVQDIMKSQWGDLYNHVTAFGNIDFSRKWVFSFDTEENNDKAVSKVISINGIMIKVEYATKKFNTVKIDWYPTFLSVEDLADIVCGLEGVTGKFFDAHRGKGDGVSVESSQVIMRFYKDNEKKFDPPSYIVFFDEFGVRRFLHLTAVGNVSKCMRCNEEGHIVAHCPLFFCFGCGHLCKKMSIIVYSKDIGKTMI